MADLRSDVNTSFDDTGDCFTGDEEHAPNMAKQIMITGVRVALCQVFALSKERLNVSLNCILFISGTDLVYYLCQAIIARLYCLFTIEVS